MDRKIFEYTAKGLIIRLKIIPNSSKNELIYENNGDKCDDMYNVNARLKIKITAQPIENKANKALIEFLSKTLKTAKSNITILKGELNKEKTLLIEGYSEEEFKKALKL